MTRKIKKAILPVAGFGTRFLPATKSQPKEMLPIVDKPVIQYLVEEAVASGIEEIIFVTGRGKRAIEDHFDVAYELEKTLVEKNKHELLAEVKHIARLAKFCYVRQPYPLGDGHAILQASHLLADDEAAVVLFGDCLYDSDVPATQQLIAAYETYGGSIIGTATVPRDDVSQFGVVAGERVDERTVRVTQMVEKPNPDVAPSRSVAVGKYIITPEVREVLATMREGKSGEIRLADAFDILLSRGATTLYAHDLDGIWLDTGDKFNFLRATIHMGLKHPALRDRLVQYIESIQTSLS